MTVVVTGYGCLTPCGNTVAALWESLVAGRSGIGPISRFDTEGFAVRIAGEVRGFDPTAVGLDAKEARRLDHFAQYAVGAAREALDRAGLPDGRVDPERVGVVIGTGIGGIQSTETQVANLVKRGPGRVSPLLVPSGTPDVASSQVALLNGVKGPTWAVCTACSSGSDAIIGAARCLLDGTADLMIAGGAEAAVTPLSIATFSNLGALSRASEDPVRVCRPFDRNRTGFVIGEGAGIVVLETLEHARSRGVEVIAVLAGWGQTTDAHHNTAPDPSAVQAARAMRLAIDAAGFRPADIGYINAHGTSTQYNDPVETRAIKQAFGESEARRVLISSSKSMTGHLIGAGGAVEAIVAIEAVRTGVVPPTINHENPDPECDLNYVPNEAVAADLRAALSNSFGFGGHNSCLVFSAYDV